VSGGYYPVNLKIEGKKCVVVGGGKVAERKVKLLLEKDALVTVVSPKVTVSLQKLHREAKIGHWSAAYSPSHLRDVFLAIAATNDRAINSRVAKDANRFGILVNVVDSPAESGFILPAILSRGDLTIAVSTAGRSPALARKIKEDLALIYPSEYSDLTEMVARTRERIKRKYPDLHERKEVWKKIMKQLW